VSSLVSGSVEAGRAVRTTMSTYSTPFLVLNLGSEMIFVIAQRLQAQNIAEERAILGDIFKLVSTFSVFFFLNNKRIHTHSQCTVVFCLVGNNQIRESNQLFDIVMLRSMLWFAPTFFCTFMVHSVCVIA